MGEGAAKTVWRAYSGVQCGTIAVAEIDKGMSWKMINDSEYVVGRIIYL